jgi:hypothetical protein
MQSSPRLANNERGRPLAHADNSALFPREPSVVWEQTWGQNPPQTKKTLWTFPSTASVNTALVNWAVIGADDFRLPIVDWCTRHLTETVTEDQRPVSGMRTLESGKPHRAPIREAGASSTSLANSGLRADYMNRSFRIR